MSDLLLTDMQENHIATLEGNLIMLLTGVSVDKIKFLACELAKKSAQYDYGCTAEQIHLMLIEKGFNFKEEIKLAFTAGLYLRDASSFDGGYA